MTLLNTPTKKLDKFHHFRETYLDSRRIICYHEKARRRGCRIVAITRACQA